RPARKTSAPCAANSFATAAPIDPPAPNTTACLPCRSCDVLIASSFTRLRRLVEPWRGSLPRTRVAGATRQLLAQQRPKEGGKPPTWISIRSRAVTAQGRSASTSGGASSDTDHDPGTPPVDRRAGREYSLGPPRDAPPRCRVRNSDP